jgi:Flp pilus assembly pilin Flp
MSPLIHELIPSDPPPQHRKAQGLVEYALILAMVAIVVVTVLTLFGEAVPQTFADLECSLSFTKRARAFNNVSPDAMTVGAGSSWEAASAELKVLKQPDTGFTAYIASHPDQEGKKYMCWWPD